VRSDLEQIEKMLRSGVSTPSKTAVLKPLQDLKAHIKKGRMKVSDARQAKIDINELRESLFDEVKGKTARKGARTKLNDISRALDKGLEGYGKTNPKFYEPYKEANEAYAGFHQSQKVGRFLSRMLKLGKFSKGGLLLLEAILKPTALPYTVGAYGALKGGELLARALKNPTLKKYYSDILTQSLKENGAGTVRSLRKLEEGLRKDPEFSQLLAEQE